MLPQQAWPVYETILDTLGDCRATCPDRPQLHRGLGSAAADRGTSPTLVATWCGLPRAVRGRSEEMHRLIEGMRTIAVELSRLAEEASSDERFLFETRQRYLDSRYRDGVTGCRRFGRPLRLNPVQPSPRT
jgi:hypothetical protein